MILVDRALAERARRDEPVRVAMSGAGFMGRGIALQIAQAVPGMRLVGIANRRLAGAERAFREAGAEDVAVVDDPQALEAEIARGRPAVTEDPAIFSETPSVDAVIEVTGTVEYAARHALAWLRGGKHVVLMNAELDGTVGPLLKAYADREGVVLTNADGDQPGVTLNLYRFVRGIGVRPVLCGNIKGLQDPHRNPTTQEGFARRWKQDAHMVTSFADGTKISFEQAIIANATGMRVARRGMYGHEVEPGTPIEEAAARFRVEELLQGPGVVDYVVGARPGPGVFVLGTHDDPAQKHYLELYKLGAGPLYCFYSPCHLCHFEVPNTVARAVLFGDATITPLDAPRVEVVATAKVDLRAGQVIDRMGGYLSYGQAENADVVEKEALLPMGVAEGCRLTRDVPADAVLRYEDVEVPEGRRVDALRAEQRAHFADATGPPQ